MTSRDMTTNQGAPTILELDAAREWISGGEWLSAAQGATLLRYVDAERERYWESRREYYALWRMLEDREHSLAEIAELAQDRLDKGTPDGPYEATVFADHVRAAARAGLRRATR